MIDVALREDNRQVLESNAILATPLLETLLNIAQGLLMAINVDWQVFALFSSLFQEFT